MNYRFISSKTHGVIDYAMGSLLMATPLVLGFEKNKAETIVHVLCGAGSTLQALNTDYELGVNRKISMTTHIAMDVACGAFLAASPWLFNMRKEARVPFLVIGLMEIGAALLTETKAGYEKNDQKDRFSIQETVKEELPELVD